MMMVVLLLNIAARSLPSACSVLPLIVTFVQELGFVSLSLWHTDADPAVHPMNDFDSVPIEPPLEQFVLPAKIEFIGSSFFPYQ
jgi:hypothetical protein